MKIPKHRLSAGAIVRDEYQHILLIKNKYRGWEYPGGFVNNRESIQDGAIREVEEETGIQVKIIDLIGVYQNKQASSCHFLFFATPLSGQLKFNDESEGIGYFTIEEALQMISQTTCKERVLHSTHENNWPYLYINS
ncbi:ADP-ribose pyrophosphatase YjhB (NUDIX family) [Caldalkalibacillus uzonensis]|uniref:ADP-ribose pyrophosphatase YjhB (NUDIX family) n=1 Tax=Caldalkalibacillus uzonensis TaxID=353224 RepID=A0ABU0CSE4_9BACI|nr:NUDIX hydrolase [Caldalkalibacillus uzonensis]MDQ0339018.1 ADP-ribose pyrophosphatase YjhB (NUDIX family) [Caldalkalibacillus uzonensis]